VRRSRAGFTIVDLMVALVVSVGVMGGLFAFLQSAITGSRMTAARAVLSRHAHDVVERVADLLLLADLDSLSPAAAPLGATFLDYRVPESVDAAGVTWANTARIERQEDPADPANGLDDDGDGVADEGVVVLVRELGLAGEQQTILATNVAPFLEGETQNVADDNGNGLEDERGFCFERTAEGRVVVRLTLFSKVAGGLLTYSAEASVFPRN